MFYIFVIWVKFDTGDVYKNILRVNVMKISAVKSGALHIEVNGFLFVLFNTYYRIWVKFVARYLPIMLLRSFKFCKYLPREDHTFLVVKSGILYTCAL